MAKISSYPSVNTPKLSDKLIGTDSNNNDATKNFSVGQLFDFYNGTNRAYISTTSDVNQFVANPDTATKVTFSSVPFSSNASLFSGTEISFNNNGLYNIQFSAHVYNDSGSNYESINIWIAINGNAVSSSNFHNTLDNTEQKQINCNFPIFLSSTDYFEIFYSVTNTDVFLDTRNDSEYPETLSASLFAFQLG
jgi:hypothetical protein